MVNRLLGMCIILCCTLILVTGCPDRRYFTPRFQAAKRAEMIIDGVESSPENPVLLCGDQDLGQLIRALICPDGKKVYPSLVAGLDREDSEFHATTKEGYRVRRFEAACYKQPYELFITTDACEGILGH